MNAPTPKTNENTEVDAATAAVSHGETQPIADMSTRGEMPAGAKLESELPGDEDDTSEDLNMIAETFEALGATEKATETKPQFDPDPDAAAAAQRASSAGPDPAAQGQGQAAAPPQGQSSEGAQPVQGQGQPQGTTAQPQAQPQGGQQAATPAQNAQQQPQEAAAQAQPSVRPFQDSFAQLRESIETQKVAVQEQVAQQLYGLTDEERDLLVTEPEKVLPQMAARVHVNAVTAMLTQISQRLPAMVLTLMEVQKAHTQAEDQFWGQFPTLNRQTDAPTVMTLMRTYRQANPNATQEEAIKQVGAMAVVALGKHLQPQAQPTAQQPVVRQVPARTAFQPAGNGQAVPSQAKPQFASEWDRTLAGLQEFEAGDM